MSPAVLLARRLASQHVSGTTGQADPAAVVRHLGAVQSQNYRQSLWAVGLRTTGATIETVQTAIDQGALLRTWPMRGTIHLVPAEDARWMLELAAKRVTRRMSGVYQRMGLSDAVFGRAAQTITSALRGGKRLRRTDVYALLAHEGMDCSAGLGMHILSCLSMTGLVCIGPMDGAQPTFALLDEWAPCPRRPADPLGELAARYFTSHGPATERDFSWWSGLNLGEVRDAIARAGAALVPWEVDGTTYWQGQGRDEVAAADGACLLPEYDEYTVAYADRRALADGDALSSGDLLNPVMVLDGRVVGVWKWATGRQRVRVALAPVARLSHAEEARFHEEAERLAAFLGLRAEVSRAEVADLRLRRPT